MLSCLLRYNGILTLILFGASIAVYAAFRLLRHRPVTAMLKRTLALLPVAYSWARVRARCSTWRRAR